VAKNSAKDTVIQVKVTSCYLLATYGFDEMSGWREKKTHQKRYFWGVQWGGREIIRQRSLGGQTSVQGPGRETITENTAGRVKLTTTARLNQQKWSRPSENPSNEKRRKITSRKENWREPRSIGATFREKRRSHLCLPLLQIEKKSKKKRQGKYPKLSRKPIANPSGVGISWGERI